MRYTAVTAQASSTTTEASTAKLSITTTQRASPTTREPGTTKLSTTSAQHSSSTHLGSTEHSATTTEHHYSSTIYNDVEPVSSGVSTSTILCAVLIPLAIIILAGLLFFGYKKFKQNGGLLVVNQNEKHWGVKVNGSYTGFTGLIARGESDVFVGPIMPTVERMEMGDITAAYLFTEIHLMTPKPEKYVDPFAFASSFSIEKPTTPFFKKLQRQVELIQGSIAPGPVQDDAFDRVEGGGHVLLHERYFQDATLAARYARRGQCRFRRARQSLHLQPVGMMLRKSLTPDIKRIINTHLRRAFEMDLKERPIQPFIFNASRCYAEEPEEAATYRLEDMQGAFFSLALGLSLSLVALLVVNQNESHWGEIVNGTFNGFSGLVVRGESDAFVGPVMPTVERLEMGYITPPYLFTEIHLMTTKPGKYVDPFAFVFSFNIEENSLHLVSCPFLGLELEGVLVAGLIQAKHEKVKKISTRILLGSWSLFLFIVVTALSSCLVSTMLVKGTEDHVNSLQDILRFPKLKIIAERRTGFEHFVMKPTTPFFRRLQRQVDLVEGSLSPGPVQDDVFDRVESGSHVLIHERDFQDATLAARYVRRGQCKFRRVPQILRLQPIVMMLRKSLKPDVKRTISTHLRRALEMALKERPMRPFIFNASRCYAEEPEEAAAYRLEDMQGAFFSLSLGLSLSLVVFTMELVVRHSSTSKLKHRQVRQAGHGGIAIP
ncbi:hypothetical protein HPB50_025132 [Hyalomma asiaticum]|uniref:Uncharacterized protein n=1 Tax=Hyalomma asiaticum TaxID=266040 RepID=A0ACB7RV78_HYAAI|nr:hypothetical protein HPB50_025132 [Hyalomma asiaticum]